MEKDREKKEIESKEVKTDKKIAGKHFSHYSLSMIFFFFSFPSLLVINPKRTAKGEREKEKIESK